MVKTMLKLSSSKAKKSFVSTDVFNKGTVGRQHLFS